MTVAQGLRKSLSIGRQTGLGVPKIGAGCFYLRRRTSNFVAARDMFEADEIVTHHQSTGASYGLRKPTGKIDGLLSSGTYQLPIEGIMEKVFVATAPYAAGADVTAAVASPQFVDASGGFLTAGLKVGDVGRWTGFTAGGAANNARNFWITALTATNMTGVFLDGTAVAAKAAGDSVTFTLVGKKVLVPLTGHTNDYFTFEEFYADLVKSELFTDARIGQVAFSLPATGNAGIVIDSVPLGRTLGVAQAQTAPAAETITAPMTAVNGAVYVNGAVAGNITGASITVANGAQGDGAVVGSNDSPDSSRGRVRVTGEFMGLFDSTVFQAFFDAETVVSLALALTADQTATSHFMAFTLGAIKITGDAPDDGEKGIVRTYPFTAELNAAGGAALAFDQTILSIQDSAAA
jgi:hypothetical protein